MSDFDQSAVIDAVPPGAKAPRPQVIVPWSLKRSRPKTFFRYFLILGQYIPLVVLSIAQLFVFEICVIPALILGRLPNWALRFISKVYAYQARVGAYMALLTDDYPPFKLNPEPGSYPIEVELFPVKMGRWGIFFRGLLAIPAYLFNTLVSAGHSFFLIATWLIGVFAGRTPVALFASNAALYRYTLRLQAYFMLLSSRYPAGLFGDDVAETELVAPGTAPEVQPLEAVDLTKPSAPSGSINRLDKLSEPDYPVYRMRREAKNILKVSIVVGAVAIAGYVVLIVALVGSGVINDVKIQNDHDNLASSFTTFNKAEETCSNIICLSGPSEVLATKLQAYAATVRKGHFADSERDALASATDALAHDIAGIATAKTGAEVDTFNEQLDSLSKAFDSAYQDYLNAVS